MDPVTQLLARDQHGIKFGLENIRTLCAALGNPQRAWQSMLIAGTNGKGSVTAMTAAALTFAGHRTGRYTSPHLVRVEERMAVENEPVTRMALAEAADAVIQAEAGCIARGELSGLVTFFEITTATAFEVFRRAGTDVVVLEVGMGGRFDATNIAEPLVSTITSIALDHVRFLGNTLADIAFEKAGVMRPGRPVVIGPLPAEAGAVVRRVARERGATIVDAYESAVVQASLGADGRTTLTLRTAAHDYGSMVLALRGRHQIDNAVIAVRGLEALATAGVSIDPASIVSGLTTVSWPARLQEIALRGGQRILLDAAHNPAGAATLAAYLTETGAQPCPIVFGAMSDKDVSGMLKALEPHASRFVFTQAHSPRAMPVEELVGQATRAGIQVLVGADAAPDAALRSAMEQSPLVVVAGSIFLIGDLLPRLESMAAARDGAAAGHGMLRADSR